MVSRKIGPHLSGGGSAQLLGRPKVAKLLDPSLAWLGQLRGRLGPECVFVVRWVHDEQTWENPEAEARAWWEAHRGFILSVPLGERVYYEGGNECPDRLAPQHVRYELERIRLLHSVGRHVAALSKGVGEPHLAVWPLYKPVLDALWATDAVALHEYWVDRADIENRWHVARFSLPDVAGWLSGRDLLITEAGRDVVEGRGEPGYQLSCNDEEFLGDLDRVGAVYDAFPRVLGACIYQMGAIGPRWVKYDVTGIWDRVVASYPAQVPEGGTVGGYPLVLRPPIDKERIVRVSQGWNPPEHFGIDWSCLEETPIYAAVDGTARAVTDIPEGGGFGRYVRIETGTHRVYTAHLKEWRVNDFARVVAGQVIGLSGDTGYSTGPHLHFEVRANAGSPYKYGAIDPTHMILWPVAVDVGSVIADAMAGRVIPLNSGAALERAGAAKGLIAVSEEAAVEVAGVRYVAQVFRGAVDRALLRVAYCREGFWGEVHWVLRPG